MNFSPPQLLGEREFCFSKSNWIWSKPSFHYVGNSISVNVGVFSSSGLSTGAGAGGTNRRWSFRSLVLRDLCPRLHEPLMGKDSLRLLLFVEAWIIVRFGLPGAEVPTSSPLLSEVLPSLCFVQLLAKPPTEPHSIHCTASLSSAIRPAWLLRGI